MTALDPALCARLVAEAREDDGRMTPALWVAEADSLYHDSKDDGPILLAEFSGEATVGEDTAIARQRNNLRDMADQLEAALAEVASLSRDGARLRADLSEVQDHHDTQRDRAQKLAAEVVSLRSDLAEAEIALERHARNLGDLR